MGARPTWTEQDSRDCRALGEAFLPLRIPQNELSLEEALTRFRQYAHIVYHARRAADTMRCAASLAGRDEWSVEKRQKNSETGVLRREQSPAES
jgi:hypothetical protein